MSGESTESPQIVNSIHLEISLAYLNRFSPLRYRTERAPSAGHEEELSGSPVSPGSEINSGSEEDGEEGDHSAKMDTNHNSHEEHNKASAATVAAAASASNMEISKSACAASSDGGAGGVHVDDDDAAMASEGDSDSLREHLQG